LIVLLIFSLSLFSKADCATYDVKYRDRHPGDKRAIVGKGTGKGGRKKASYRTEDNNDTPKLRGPLADISSDHINTNVP
jgi:hypothetical protein